jgi:hypothetical protein
MTLKEIWRRWTKIAKVIGEFQSRLILTIFYFFILAPVALCVRIFSDPLRLKLPARVSWSAVNSSAQRSIDGARKQF